MSQPDAGDPEDAAAILPLVYDHLRRIAAAQLRGQPEQTLQATALGHEAFLRLAGGTQEAWQNRGHFLAVVTRAMRQILIDHARGRARQKRGGGGARMSLEDAEPATDAPGIDLVALHLALERLTALDPRTSRIAELKLFAGALNEELAELLDMSLRTVEREWRRAKAWLERELAE